MSPALIQLFVFMTCTFVLGLFLGWVLWRYGGVSKAAIEDLEAKVDFWKRSSDQSRKEVWDLQEGNTPQSKAEIRNRPMSRRRSVSESLLSDADLPAGPTQ